jgi:hypothetical protein
MSRYLLVIIGPLVLGAYCRGPQFKHVLPTGRQLPPRPARPGGVKMA